MNEIFPYKRILIIDDDEMAHYLTHQTIKMHDRSLSVYHAMDVDSGIDMYKSFKTPALPNLILLDLYFERQHKQGKDFIAEFQQLHKEIISRTRLIVLTALSFYNEGQEHYEKNAEIIMLPKPFTINKIMEQ